MKKNTPERFTALSNTIVRDDKLSWKARGIFLYLFSQSDDWDFYETEVANHATDGRDSLRSGLKELEEKGYIQRERVRNEKGQLMSSNWLLSDKPMLKKPMYDYPTQVSGTLSNTNLSNTNLSNTNNKKTPPVLSSNTNIVSTGDEKKDVAVSKKISLQSNTEVTNSNDSKSKNIDIELENTTTEKKEVATLSQDSRKNVTQSKSYSNSLDLEKAYKKIVAVFENNGFGSVGGIVQQSLSSELNDFAKQSNINEAYNLIIKAIEIAVNNNKNSFAYVWGITKRWYGSNIFTLEAYNAEEKKKNFNKDFNNGTKKEKLKNGGYGTR